MKSSIKQLPLAALALAACVGSAQAATKITYDDIPKHIAPFGAVLKHRSFKVTTIDGKTHKGATLFLYGDRLALGRRDGSYEDAIPSGQITRIEIRQFGRFTQYMVWNSDCIPLGAPPGLLPHCHRGASLRNPSTPVLLTADAITFFIPPKVYEIVH